MIFRAPKPKSKTTKVVHAENPIASKVKSKKRNNNEIVSEEDKKRDLQNLNEISKEKTRKLLFESNQTSGENLIKNAGKHDSKKKTEIIDFKDIAEASEEDLIEQVFGRSFI